MKGLRSHRSCITGFHRDVNMRCAQCQKKAILPDRGPTIGRPCIITTWIYLVRICLEGLRALGYPQTAFVLDLNLYIMLRSLRRITSKHTCSSWNGQQSRRPRAQRRPGSHKPLHPLRRSRPVRHPNVASPSHLASVRKPCNVLLSPCFRGGRRLDDKSYLATLQFTAD